MRTHVDPKFMMVAHKVGKIKWLKSVLKPFKKIYINRIVKNRNRLFLKNGIAVFKELDELLRKYNINYSVTYGTLLGAIREKSPIRHDCDFDICIWAADFSNNIQTLLELNGFKLFRRILVEDGKLGREETYSKKGVDVDFFYVYSDESYPSYSCCFTGVEGSLNFEDSMKKHGFLLVRRLQIPISKKLIRIPFADIEVNAMSNYLEFLEVCYGKNFMTPDSTYQPIDGDSIRFIWNDKRGVVTS